MDYNLIKIRDHNLHLIRKGKLSRPIIQAKSYLAYILADNWQAIDREMDEFVADCKTLITPRKTTNGKQAPQKTVYHQQRSKAPTKST